MSKKRMSKTITGTVVAITVIDGENGTMEFNFNDLPEEIQVKFGPFGLGHKLGDAAAGKKGVDAEEAITKVFDGLMDSNWSVRAPAAPKVSTKVISENFGNLSEDEQAAAKAVLASLGINIPGISKE